MSFPLAPPSGMHDLLPPHAAERARLGSRLTQLFGAWGYELVTTPPFEHAEVIERGLDTLDRRDLLRFVEPESGEVALLRPDITPQIARIVATRLADRPPPFRLCYAGSVIRQRRGRARRQRQIAQAGVELIGLEGTDADLEVIGLACRALEEVGLTEYRIELSLVGLARGAIGAVPEAGREAVEAALIQKDAAALARALREAGAGREVSRRLLGIAELYGEVSVLREARALFRSATARAGLRQLERVIAQLEEAGFGDRLAVDLGEVRGASYYSGPSFSILARGPGEPVGSGGRYDDLLGRFGAPRPATGFGLDLSNLEWALEAAGHRAPPPRAGRVVVAGGRAEARQRLAARFRASGVGAAVIPERGRDAALDYARRWGYDAAVMSRGESAEATRRDGARRDVSPAEDLSELASWAREQGSEA